MKLLITYLTLIALACNSAKVSNDYRLEEFGHNELKLIYQAHTRGFFEEVSEAKAVIFFTLYTNKSKIKTTFNLEIPNYKQSLKNCIEIIKNEA